MKRGTGEIKQDFPGELFFNFPGLQQGPSVGCSQDGTGQGIAITVQEGYGIPQG